MIQTPALKRSPSSSDAAAGAAALLAAAAVRLPAMPRAIAVQVRGAMAHSLAVTRQAIALPAAGMLPVTAVPVAVAVAIMPVTAVPAAATADAGNPLSARRRGHSRRLQPHAALSASGPFQTVATRCPPGVGAISDAGNPMPSCRRRGHFRQRQPDVRPAGVVAIPNAGNRILVRQASGYFRRWQPDARPTGNGAIPDSGNPSSLCLPATSA